MMNQGQTAGAGHARQVDRDEESIAMLVQRCDETLTKVLAAIEESGTVSRRAIERISEMDAASVAILKALEELEQIAQGNRMMALNARIEASHAGEKGAGFAVVAVEVAAQTEKSQEVTARVGRVVEQLRELAGSTLEDLEQMIARDAGRAAACRQEVDEALGELRSGSAAGRGGFAGAARGEEQYSPGIL